MKQYVLGWLTAAVVLLMLCGCSGNDTPAEPQQDPQIAAANQYIDSLNERLVSFSDCANRVSDCMESFADTTAVPTEAQMTELEECLNQLAAACEALKLESVPSEYAEAQTALNQAMDDYAAAIEKCRTLLTFYRGYDAKFRSYDTPSQGSAKMKQQTEAVYAEFAGAMETATASFHSAVNLLGNVS